MKKHYLFSVLLLTSISTARGQDGVTLGDGGTLEQSETMIERNAITTQNAVNGLLHSIWSDSHINVPTEFSHAGAPTYSTWTYQSRTILHARFIVENHIPMTPDEFAQVLMNLKSKIIENPHQANAFKAHQILLPYFKERSAAFQLETDNIIFENIFNMGHEQAKYWFNYYDVKYGVDPKKIDQILNNLIIRRNQGRTDIFVNLLAEAKQRNHQIAEEVILNLLTKIYMGKVWGDVYDITYGRGSPEDQDWGIREIRDYLVTQPKAYQEKIIHLLIITKLRLQVIEERDAGLSLSQTLRQLQVAEQVWNEHLLTNHLERDMNKVEFTEAELVSAIEPVIQSLDVLPPAYEAYLETKSPEYQIKVIDLILSTKKVNNYLLSTLYDYCLARSLELPRDTFNKALSHGIRLMGIFGSSKTASEWLDYAKIYHPSADWTSYETEIQRPILFGTNSRLLGFFSGESRKSEEPVTSDASEKPTSHIKMEQEYTPLSLDRATHNLLHSQTRSRGEINHFLYQLPYHRFTAMRDLFREMNLELKIENNSPEIERGVHYVMYALEREKRGSPEQQKLLSATFVALLRSGSRISDLVGFQGVFEKTFDIKITLPEVELATVAVGATNHPTYPASATSASPHSTPVSRSLVQGVPQASTVSTMDLAADRIMLQLRTNIIHGSWLEVGRATLQREAIAAHLESLAKHIELLNPEQSLNNISPNTQEKLIADIRAFRTANLALPIELRNRQLTNVTNNFLNDTESMKIGEYFDIISRHLEKLRVIYAAENPAWKSRFQPGYYQQLEINIRLEVAKVLSDLTQEETAISNREILQLIDEFGQTDGHFREAFVELYIRMNSEHTLRDGRKLNLYHELVDGIRITLNELIEQANLPIAQFKMMSGKSNGLTSRHQLEARNDLKSEPVKARILEITTRMIKTR